VTDTHASHALIETLAALVLTVGGAAVVVRAWLDRRRTARSGVMPVSPGRATASPSPWSAGLVALLSGAAAAIHLAAGPEHVEAVGDLGLGFYWAALTQGGFALAWLFTARPTHLAWLGIALNAGLIGVWAWSRTIGVGLLPDGPEPAGVADTITVLIEGILIGLLAHRLVTGSRWSDGDSTRLVGPSAAVAIAGVAVVMTAIAIVDLRHGHSHGDTGAAQAAHGAQAVSAKDAVAP